MRKYSRIYIRHDEEFKTRAHFIGGFFIPRVKISQAVISSRVAAIPPRPMGPILSSFPSRGDPFIGTDCATSFPLPIFPTRRT